MELRGQSVRVRFSTATCDDHGLPERWRTGRRDVPEGYLSRLIRLTCWIVAEPRPRRRDLQIVLGPWVRVLMLRCAGMAFLRVWWYTVARPWREGPLSMPIRRELMQLCFASLLWFADWKVGVCGRVSISDASPEGAGVCYSTKLSASGVQAAVRALPQVRNAACDHLVVWGLFDGIGGLRKSLE